MINIYNIFVRMKISRCLALFFLFLSNRSLAQQPPSFTSSDILLQIHKLKVLGSALYIAAHPDDENTRLLSWFSKERLMKTGYLSITRGDGGQNLIGDQQGIELGLIRTQELLAARRVDGAEQFFTRAFDFGFSKQTAEAMRLWGKEQVLGDIVWVIRKFRPDVIITRFPEDSRAGHGQHSASAVLAREAFHAAADKNAYASQLTTVQPWQAKRILWNNYNFGNTRPEGDDLLVMDVGGYIPLLGKSLGEIAAESRSQHKSQGFGVAASRGPQAEYFSHTDGNRAVKDITEGIDFSWNRIGAPRINGLIDRIISNYSSANPAASVPALVSLYQEIARLPTSYWRDIKMKELQEIIAACKGLWLEAFVTDAYAEPGKPVKVNVSVNNRDGALVKFTSFSLSGKDTSLSIDAKPNNNVEFSQILQVPEDFPVSQPYWLREKMQTGAFTINDQRLIGLPENPAPFVADFELSIGGQKFVYHRPVVYKHTDPVKGELYQPLVVRPSAKNAAAYGNMHHLRFDHIPDIYYFNNDSVRFDLTNVRIAGKNIGYIEGAGDKVPEALARMGYTVTLLKEKDILPSTLASFDAVITGVRAFNVHAFLSQKNKELNEYVQNGGNLIVQYNTNSFVGPFDQSIGPLKFRISRNRITDEHAPVRFLLPAHAVLHFPNVITKEDFDNWVQERGIYFAEQTDTAFRAPLAMHDPGEAEQNGSLIIAD